MSKYFTWGWLFSVIVSVMSGSMIYAGSLESCLLPRMHSCLFPSYCGKSNGIFDICQHVILSLRLCSYQRFSNAKRVVNI